MTTPEQLEQALAQLDETQLGLIARYTGFHLLMTERGFPGAPDAQGRRLAPIFTTEAARDAFRQQMGYTTADTIDKTVTGQELFPHLRDMHLDGAVFNCSGPQPAIFLPPKRIAELCVHAQPGGPTKGDFDRLASAAFPEGEPGPMAALDALWTELLDLPEWIFALPPKQTANPYPLISIYNNRRAVFAFTDSDRARQFCEENNLLDSDKTSRIMTMPLPGVLNWIAEAGAKGEFEVVHFNFGGIGWFCPAENFPIICRHLGKFADLPSSDPAA